MQLAATPAWGVLQRPPRPLVRTSCSQARRNRAQRLVPQAGVFGSNKQREEEKPEKGQAVAPVPERNVVMLFLRPRKAGIQCNLVSGIVQIPWQLPQQAWPFAFDPCRRGHSLGLDQIRLHLEKCHKDQSATGKTSSKRQCCAI